MNQPTRRVARPRRSHRPVDFYESLSPALPARLPLAPVASAQSWSPGVLRGGLYSLWALAAVAAGAGLGLYIIGQQPAPVAIAPAPLASAAVKVAAASASHPAAIVRATIPARTALRVRPASSLYQSQTGDVWHVVPATSFQPAAHPVALQPGFQPLGFGQGGPGTDPVAIR